MKAGKRKFFLVCLSILLVALLVVFAWISFLSRQVPTHFVVPSEFFLIAHGPLKRNDEGVKLAWEALVEETSRNAKEFAFVLKLLKLPKELTFVAISPNGPGLLAVNFQRGTSLLWLILRLFGKPYGTARYLGSKGNTFGMFGGTVLITDSEANFRLAVDTISQNLSNPKPQNFSPSKLRNKYDFICIVNTRASRPESAQMPASLVEIGVDIVSADKFSGQGLTVFQSEREAEIGAERMLKELNDTVQSMKRKGINFSFKLKREGPFVWLEFKGWGENAVLKAIGLK